MSKRPINQNDPNPADLWLHDLIRRVTTRDGSAVLLTEEGKPTVKIIAGKRKLTTAQSDL